MKTAWIRWPAICGLWFLYAVSRAVARLAKPAHAVAEWALTRIARPAITADAIGWLAVAAVALVLLLAGRAL